jgi:hypothetical protein
MTISNESKAGTRFRRKIIQFIKPKCHAILLDTQINSIETVWFNVYQIALVAAMKFYCHATELPKSPLENARFIVGMVQG